MNVCRVWVSPSKLSRMSHRPGLMCAIVMFVVLARQTDASAQSTATIATPQGVVVLTKLSDPVYPPLTRTAHITGDVELMLEVRQDGSIDSAVVVGGPPLLQKAA